MAEDSIFDEQGTIRPLGEYEGHLSVYLEDVSTRRLKWRNAEIAHFKLSNGHVLTLFIAQLADLLRQVQRTYPGAFFSTPQEALDFIKSKNLPIAVYRSVELGLPSLDEDEPTPAFWKYNLPGLL